MRPIAVVAALLLAGAAVRLAPFLHCRSLWLDEAMLALNVAGRSFAELLQPLDYIQAAPILYLWIERALFLGGLALGAAPEWALRTLPFAGGIAVLALLPRVARDLAGDDAVVPAAALAAFSPTLIWYSNEAKPYGSDALATVVVLWAALGLRAEPENARRWRLFGAAGTFAILVSFPGLFVAAAAGLFALLDDRLRPFYRRTATWGAAWVATAAATYVGIYRTVANETHQHEAYAEAFLGPGADWTGRALHALRGSLLPAFMGTGAQVPRPSTLALAALAAALIAGGVWIARRSGRAAPLLLLAPFVFAVAASTLQRYPLGVPRLMVFGAPLLLLLAASTLAAVLSPLRSPVLRTVLAALLIGAAMGPGAWAIVRTPFEGEDARSLVAFYFKKRRQDEPVYVTNHGLPSWLFYTTNWRDPSRERLRFYAQAAASDGPAFENAPSRSRPVTPGEGHNLVFEHRQRRELLGLFPGRQWRWRSGFATPTADEGWAANEASRIAGAATPCAWLYATRLSDRTLKPITWHIRDTHRGDRRNELWVPGGGIIRYCFAPGGSEVAAPSPGP